MIKSIEKRDECIIFREMTSHFYLYTILQNVVYDDFVPFLFINRVIKAIQYVLK
jgi:hypothetical protein